MDNEEGSRSSIETSSMDEEKAQPAGVLRSRGADDVPAEAQSFHTNASRGCASCTVQIAFVAALGLVLRSQSRSSLPASMPPERTAKKLFIYQSVFRGEPDAKSEEVWTKLILSISFSLLVRVLLLLLLFYFLTLELGLDHSLTYMLYRIGLICLNN